MRPGAKWFRVDRTCFTRGGGWRTHFAACSISFESLGVDAQQAHMIPLMQVNDVVCFAFGLCFLSFGLPHSCREKSRTPEIQRLAYVSPSRLATNPMERREGESER